jgi:hypothetical protein
MIKPRIDTMLFPEGKTKALTLSYDDGVIQDRRLISLMNSYNVKGTFNIGSGLLGVHDSANFAGTKTIDISKVDPDEVKELYAGHEVAGHGLYHSSLADIGTPAAMYEVIEDRKRLEDLTGSCVRGFAYPFGVYNEDVKTILKLAGYEYARVVPSTGTFEIPADFLEWKATCHHNDERLMDLAKDFCEKKGRFRRTELFYLWGHSYEFDFGDNWHVIENFLQYVAQFKELLWYATNIEICDYITSYKKLKYSADCKTIINPGASAVWIGIYGETYKIEPGATFRI